MHKRATSSSPQARNLIAFSALIMILFCVIVALQASRAYETSVAHGRANADRLTKSLGDHIELTFMAADLTIRRAVERQYFNDLFGGKLPKDMENNFRLWVNQTPQVTGMYMLASSGTVEYFVTKGSYANVFPAGSDSVRQTFFADLRDGSDTHLAVWSQPVPGEPGRSVIMLGRKVMKLDGSFGGIVAVSIDPSYYVQFFSSVETGTNSFMALVLGDGTILVSGPNTEKANYDIVKHIHQKQDDTARPGMSTELTTVENSIKIYSYRFFQQLPLFTAVILDEEDFLRDWSTDRVKDIGFLAIFAIFGSVLSFFALTMAKQIKRVEESESTAVLASQAKSEFLANMSHELRTPLNAIIGFSEMLDSGYFGQLTPKQHERIHDINLCGNHLLQLINDILEFSKGEAGKLQLTEEDIAVADIFHECQRMMVERANSNGVKLEVNVDANLPLLWADKRKVRQVVLNLLSNSVKFTPKEGTVTMRAALDPAHNMVLIVEDTGIGIPDEDIPKALSVFGQVHRHMSHEGTGLGLPLCKMFVELHGGKFILESKVGQGTRVLIIMPHQRLVRGGEKRVATSN